MTEGVAFAAQPLLYKHSSHSDTSLEPDFTPRSSRHQSKPSFNAHDIDTLFAVGGPDSPRSLKPPSSSFSSSSSSSSPSSSNHSSASHLPSISNPSSHHHLSFTQHLLHLHPSSSHPSSSSSSSSHPHHPHSSHQNLLHQSNLSITSPGSSSSSSSSSSQHPEAQSAVTLALSHRGGNHTDFDALVNLGDEEKQREMARERQRELEQQREKEQLKKGAQHDIDSLLGLAAAAPSSSITSSSSSQPSSSPSTTDLYQKFVASASATKRHSIPSLSSPQHIPFKTLLSSMNNSSQDIDTILNMVEKEKEGPSLREREREKEKEKEKKEKKKNRPKSLSLPSIIRKMNKPVAKEVEEIEDPSTASLVGGEKGKAPFSFRLKPF